MQPEQERDVLGLNPWGFDETDYTPLTDRFVVTRRPHGCAVCLGSIPAGSRVRAKTERLNEGRSHVKTFYFCVPCCRAMARARRRRTLADDLAWERRFEVGRKRADADRRTP